MGQKDRDSVPRSEAIASDDGLRALHLPDNGSEMRRLGGHAQIGAQALVDDFDGRAGFID